MVAYIISGLGVTIALVSLIFVAKGSKRTDVKDIETEARDKARLYEKLDTIARDTADVKADLKQLRSELQAQVLEIERIKTIQQTDTRRIDELEKAVRTLQCN